MTEVTLVSRQSSESFDEHERPTAQRSRLEGDHDPNATTRIKPFDLEQLVAKGSGTRPVVTPEQIDRYREAHTVEIGDEPHAAPIDDAKDRETVDALTLQRETLIIARPDTVQSVQSSAQQIPIDVDLSRLDIPSPRPAAGRPVPWAARTGSALRRRPLIVAGALLIATISAVVGFIAGRL
jgi:hypothetical protein